MIAKEVLDRRESLRDPGPFVEEEGRLEKGCEIDLDPSSSHGLETGERRIEENDGIIVAEKGELIRPRHAEGEIIGPPPARFALGPRVGIVSIEPLRGREDRGRLGGRFGENRDTVERATGGHHAPGREQAETGFQADQFVQTRRDAARPGRVGAEGKADEIARHGHGRARGGAAGDEVGMKGILRRAIGRAHPDEAGGELIEVRFPHRDRSRRDQFRDDGGVLGRIVGIVRAGRRRRGGGEVEVVLDRKGDPVERERVGRSRLERREHRFEPFLGRQGDPDTRIRRGDAFAQSGDEVSGSQRASPVGGEERGDGKGRQHDGALSARALHASARPVPSRVGKRLGGVLFDQAASSSMPSPAARMGTASLRRTLRRRRAPRRRANSTTSPLCHQVASCRPAGSKTRHSLPSSRWMTPSHMKLKCLFRSLFLFMRTTLRIFEESQHLNSVFPSGRIRPFPVKRASKSAEKTPHWPS